MSRRELASLIQAIRQELDEIHTVLSRIHQGWLQARRLNDDLYLGQRGVEPAWLLFGL